MVERKAKPVDELEALLQRFENERSESEEVRTACREIRAGWKSGDIATVALEAFRLGQQVKQFPYMPHVLIEMQRKHRKRQADQQRRSAADDNVKRARTLLATVPAEVKARGRMAVYKWLAKELNVKPGTVRKTYLKGVEW